MVAKIRSNRRLRGSAAPLALMTGAAAASAPGGAPPSGALTASIAVVTSSEAAFGVELRLSRLGRFSTPPAGFHFSSPWTCHSKPFDGGPLASMPNVVEQLLLSSGLEAVEATADGSGWLTLDRRPLHRERRRVALPKAP